jgi:hypothetical protein
MSASIAVLVVLTVVLGGPTATHHSELLILPLTQDVPSQSNLKFRYYTSIKWAAGPESVLGFLVFLALKANPSTASVT